MKMDKTGHIRCDCFLMDAAGIGNRLTFKLDLDQTYLPALLNEIDVAISAFSIVGVR
jgi:hypothetical protein